MTYKTVHLAIDSEKIRLHLTIDGKTYLISEKLHMIDVYDWSLEKIAFNVDMFLESFFDCTNENIPDYSMTINGE